MPFQATNAPVAQPAAPPADGEAPQQQQQQTQQQSPEAWLAAVEKARLEERAKLAAALKAQEEAAKAAAEKAAAAEKERAAVAERLRQIETDKLPPDERVQAQLREMQERIAQSEAARQQNEVLRQQELQQLQAQLHAERMEAYRNRRLAEFGVGNLIPEFVGGNTPEEIDASIQTAAAEYQKLRDRHLQEFQQLYGAAPQGQGATNAPPSVVQGAPAEHYPAPRGLPSGYAPVSAPAQSPNLAALTTEQAVRSGEYARYRQDILNNMRTQASTGSMVLGNGPRYGVPTPQGTLTVPQGLPSAPARSPSISSNAAVLNRQQQPTGAPVAASPVADARAAALEAIARTNAGGNPLLQSQAHLSRTGVGNLQPGDANAARAAYNARFQDSPPVTAQA
jgi:chemotaxis protein histidine kinase CheA